MREPKFIGRIYGVWIFEDEEGTALSGGLTRLADYGGPYNAVVLNPLAVRDLKCKITALGEITRVDADGS